MARLMSKTVANGTPMAAAPSAAKAGQHTKNNMTQRLSIERVCLKPVFGVRQVRQSLDASRARLAMVNTANAIRDAFVQVADLRAQTEANPTLGTCVHQVKVLQAARFSGTYRDVLSEPKRADASAAQFFLTKLYSPADQRERDAQFVKIAGAIEKLFPAHVGALAVRLAQLHALTEALDVDLAKAWMTTAPHAHRAQRPALAGAALSDLVEGYVRAWRHLGRRADRASQLATVLDIGDTLGRLTQTPGLRHLLRMMRGPARAADLADLQGFLEQGFDTFRALAGTPSGVAGFLELISTREAALLHQLFDMDLVASVTQLRTTLGLPP